MSKAKARISDPQIRVVIAGHLKQGKSQLLNSLLNVPVSRVGDDETTVVATMVSYGEQATAKLMVAGTDEGVPDAIEIPIADIKNDLRRHPAGRRQAGTPSRGDRATARCSRVGWCSSTPQASAVTASRICRPRSGCCQTPTRC